MHTHAQLDIDTRCMVKHFVCLHRRHRVQMYTLVRVEIVSDAVGNRKIVVRQYIFSFFYDM